MKKHLFCSEIFQELLSDITGFLHIPVFAFLNTCDRKKETHQPFRTWYLNVS